MSKGRAEAATGGKWALGAGEAQRRAGGGSAEWPPRRLSHLFGSPRDPPEVPAGAEPALQRPGCVREPAAGTRAGQSGEDPLPGFPPRGPQVTLRSCPLQAAVLALGFLGLWRAAPSPWLPSLPGCPARGHSDCSAPSPLPGGGEGAGPAGPARQDQRKDVRQAEDLFCGPGEGRLR